MAPKDKTKAWDLAEHIDTEEAVIAYIEAAFEDGDPAVITAVLGTVAKSKGMTEIAKKTGLSRESLYKSLAENGNPSFATIMKVLSSLGIRLEAKLIEVERA